MEESNIFDDLMDFRGSVDFSKALKDKKEETEKDLAEEKLKPSQKLLNAIIAEGFDLSQMEPILRTKGNQLVISCAGSGKTTSLIFKVIFDLKTGYATRVMDMNGNQVRIPDKIWVSTFLKSGAEELNSSLKKWQRRLHCVDTSKAITFSTLHAEFKRALTAMGVATPIVSGKDNSNYLKDVVKPYQLLNEKGRPLTSEDYKDLESALSYTRGRLDESRYNSKIYYDLNIGAPIIDLILRDWKAKRITQGVYDFEDMQEKLYSECVVKNNQEVIDFLSKRYNFIYLDEFQDTSQIQYMLLQIYALGSKQVVVYGDDDQTIYSWRGSDHRIITEKFAEDFSPTVNILSQNFRCPQNILNAIKPCIEQNTERFEKDLYSSKDGGIVRVAPCGSYAKMVSTLSDLVYEDIKQDRDVAILCRVNSDGLLPALILDKLDKFSFSISGEGMSLDSFIGRLVLSIVKLFTEKTTPSVKSALKQLSWDSYGIDNLMKILKNNKLSIWSIDEKDLAYSCPSIAEKILTWRGWRKSMGEIQTLRLVLQDYRLNVFNNGTPFSEKVRSVLSSVEALIDYFNYEYVEDFEMELDDINERLKGRKGKESARVRIATVHEMKGKEASSVYVWNATEDVYPIRDSAETLTLLEEERRIFYIACTRAKDISTLVYSKNSPSMFLSEMDLSMAEIVNSTGEVQGILNKNAEQNKNLQLFEKSASETEELIVDLPYNQDDAFKDTFSPTSQYDGFLDVNEFWTPDDLG